MSDMSDMAQLMDDVVRLGAAIRARRTALGLTQKQLATAAGLPAAQTVSDIEKGEREVKTAELVRIARVLHVDPATLLAAETSSEEPRVLWRRGVRAVDRRREAQLLERARRYARLETWCNEVPSCELPDLPLDPVTAKPHEVEHLAERVRDLLKLGPFPQRTLLTALEEDCGVKVFFEHLTRAGDGESSAACVRAPDFGAAILMNAAEVPWRQTFNFAHELFHLVTWNAVERAWAASGSSEEGEPSWYQALERLADRFAGTLLMPAESLTARFDARVRDGQIAVTDLVRLAADFGVSTIALMIRLEALARLPKNSTRVLADNLLAANLRRELDGDRSAPPVPFPERYVHLVRTAYRKREIGRAIVAKFLETSVAELDEWNLPTPDVSETALTVA